MQVDTYNSLNDWFRADILTVIGILLSVFAILISLWGWTIRAWLTERRLVNQFGADLYLPEDIKNATRYYVRPDATSIDLAQEMEENNNVVATREDLFKAVERFIDEESPYRHLLLLADSGMGKSSFVLNYYDYNRRKWLKRYKLAVIPLGYEKALEKIIEIEKPNETILFLDAFDEDPNARNRYEQRINELMTICSEFRRVLITCRTQFFPEDTAIPKTSTWIFTPRIGTAQHTFWRLYLAPFNDKQVDKFLSRRFRFWSFAKKSKARELAKKVPKLTVRPMLLTHVPDFLLTETQVTTSWDIYEMMTEKWYVREQGFWKTKEELKTFSEEVAVRFYLGFLESGSDRVPREVILNILNDLRLSNIHIDEWKATARSLLHRDAKGDWKFAHRSIMEFLFLKRFFNGDNRCIGVEWTEQMKKFILEKSVDTKLPLFLSLGSINGADLSGVDISGVCLSKVNLSEVNFRNAKLNGADLSGADLSGADLRKADLSGANLYSANLNGANLYSANLNKVNLQEAKLNNVKLGKASLNGVNLRRANLNGIILSGASLNQADLREAQLSLANLSGTLLKMAKLQNADLSDSNLSGADLSDADLSGVNLNGATLKSADLSGADLSKATLISADVLDAIFRNAKFDKTNISLIKNMDNKSVEGAIINDGPVL